MQVENCIDRNSSIRKEIAKTSSAWDRYPEYPIEQTKSSLEQCIYSFVKAWSLRLCVRSNEAFSFRAETYSVQEVPCPEESITRIGATGCRITPAESHERARRALPWLTGH